MNRHDYIVTTLFVLAAVALGVWSVVFLIGRVLVAILASVS